MKQLLKILTVLSCSIFFVSTIHGQETSEKLYKDKVITKDGSILVGSIIAYDPDEFISVELKNGNMLKFNSNQIRKVIMYSPKGQEVSIPLKTKRLYNETQFSLLTGESGTGVSFAHNVLYQWNSYLALGVGTGIDNYYVKPGRDIYPVFANAKINLSNGFSAPYIGAKVGYGMAFKNESEDIFSAKGGMMFNPYFGIRKGSRGMIFNIFSGLKFQKADYEIIRSFETRIEDIFYRRLEIGTSVMF